MHLGNVSQTVSWVQSGVGEPEGRWIDGRMVRVFAGGTDSPTKYTAAGLSYVPAGVVTAPHSHESEEIALIVSGSGVIAINGTEYPVAQGDLIFVESGLPHRTWADPGSDLGVFWTYAPPDSVVRWLNQPGEES